MTNRYAVSSGAPPNRPQIAEDEPGRREMMAPGQPHAGKDEKSQKIQIELTGPAHRRHVPEEHRKQRQSHVLTTTNTVYKTTTVKIVASRTLNPSITYLPCGSIQSEWDQINQRAYLSPQPAMSLNHPTVTEPVVSDWSSTSPASSRDPRIASINARSLSGSKGGAFSQS